jgi:serine phosphatase RsbU (regulator of sigma subunit)
LRNLIKKALRQEKENPQRDGMDIALCIIDLSKNTLNFAGANSDLIYLKDNELHEIKGKRQPIGIHRKETSFSEITITVDANYTFYIFSDGFAYQVGGVKDEKF